MFEGFGPIGERREKDLAGRPIDASATFPGGGQGTGVEGLRQYIRERRQNDFINNMSGKLLACALGRSLIFSDEALIQEMRGKLAANGYRFDNLVATIVTSPQFLTKRGRQDRHIGLAGSVALADRPSDLRDCPASCACLSPCPR